MKKCPIHKINLKQDITKDFNIVNKDYSLICPKCNFEIIILKERVSNGKQKTIKL